MSIRRHATAALALMLALGLAAIGVGPATPGATAHATEATGIEVVASGLSNPRGIAFSPDGTLYVAEAGRGGDLTCIAPDGDLECFGLTGALTSVRDGRQVRVLDGLPSVANPDGTAAIGLHDLDATAGRITGVMGLSAHPDHRADLGPAAALLGHVVRIVPNGDPMPVSDLAAYEAAHNPDGRSVYANPLALTPAAPGVLVVDAGANALLHVNPAGHVALETVFEPRDVEAPARFGLPPGTMMSMESVPTAITPAPGGGYLVGELTGFPGPLGSARVYHVTPGQAPVVVADGFTNIMDLAVDGEGRLLVLEVTRSGLYEPWSPDKDLTGALWRIEHDGERVEIAPFQLHFPTDLTVGPDGAVYVTNVAYHPTDGQVLRISGPALDGSGG